MLQWYDTWVVVRVVAVVHTRNIENEFKKHGHGNYVPGTSTPKEAKAYYAGLYPDLNVDTCGFCFFKIVPVEFKFGQALICGGCAKVVGTKPSKDRKAKWATCGNCTAYKCSDCLHNKSCNICCEGNLFLNFEFCIENTNKHKQTRANGCVNFCCVV